MRLSVAEAGGVGASKSIGEDIDVSQFICIGVIKIKSRHSQR